MHDQEFYEEHKTISCLDKLFAKDTRKIKRVLDNAMDKYDRTISTSELEALFFSEYSTLTTSNKVMYQDLFSKIRREDPMSADVASDVLSRMCQQYVGEVVANLGFDYVNGKLKSLDPLRQIIEKHEDNFMPSVNVEWADIDIDTILEAGNKQSQWKWNIPSLASRIEGISGGHFVIVGARPNTGKTSFHASTIAAPNGFADQGAKCMILCNEEEYVRVAERYLCAASSMDTDEIKSNYALAAQRYKKVRNQISMVDSMGQNLDWVENIIKHSKPDIVILDMGDKFAVKTSDQTDVYLKAAAIHARNIAKKYDCAIIWMSQLSADAQDKVYLDQSMLEGSKTGKAAEADLMLLIAKNPVTEGSDDDKAAQRHINVAKNKLKGGWHGVIHCELDGSRSQYLA
tara:strand:+ start:50 stop:1252 length:1203 start_codon:yes stop_codon:yes gene_type:complete